MNDQPAQDLLTVEHFARFGSIINSFARLEYLVQVTMAAVAGVPDLKIIILTKALSYGQKRDTLYSYLELYKMENQAHESAIKAFLDRAHRYNPLRNNIAHALWREGIRPSAIRAGYLDVRRGKGKIVGYEDDEKDYTLSIRRYRG